MYVCICVCIMYICLPCCFWKLMYIMTTRSLQVDIICVCLKSRMYEHDDLTHDFANSLTYLLAFLPTYSRTHDLPCMHTYVMIAVIWSGTILLVAFIITTSYCYDQDGETAMIRAAYNGHKDIVEYLVSQGADKDIKNNVSTNLIHAHAPSLMYVCIHRWISICMYMHVYINMYVYDMWLVLCLMISYLHVSYTVIHTHLHVHVYRC